VRPSAPSVGIGGLPLSQNIPLGSAAAGAAEDATGAAVALADATGVALDCELGGVVVVVVPALECPQAQPKHATITQRNEDMAATILGGARRV
jgi:hypothetical protein